MHFATVTERSSWLRDPVVLLAAALSVLSSGYVFFAGRYLPYIDWSNHLGLIAVFAHGGSTGALTYLERSFLPTPYMSFYAASAVLAQLMAVDVAAKVALSVAGGLMVLAAADLADATGRSPRLAVCASLALFGLSLGWGFASFLFATPFLFFVLASAERAFAASADARRRRGLFLALALSAVLLSHGVVFLVAGLLVGLRALQLLLRGLLRGDRRSAVTPLLTLALASIPATLLALPQALIQLRHPFLEAGARSALELSPFSERVQQFGGHLLERGSSGHWSVMFGLLGLFGALLIYSMVHPRTVQPALSGGLELYALGLVALYAFGPNGMNWPTNVWLIYPRFAVMAALALFLLPRVELDRPIGLALCATGLALVFWNAKLNAEHVRQFSGWAAPYDRVRALVPPRARVLALTVVPGDDLANNHPALGSLYFYHLVDGASYTPFLFDHPAHPVHHREGPKPRAPFWRTPNEYDPRIHGRDYDFLVLRGPELITRTVAAGEHRLIENVSGWAVFETLHPAPIQPPSAP